MCNFKVLEQNNNGYVVQCESCGHFQMVFGNVAIIANEQTFFSFAKMIAKFTDEKKSITERDLKNIYLESPCRNILLVFSANELEQLNHLLEQSVVAVQINKLLESK